MANIPTTLHHSLAHLCRVLARWFSSEPANYTSPPPEVWHAFFFVLRECVYFLIPDFARTPREERIVVRLPPVTPPRVPTPPAPAPLTTDVIDLTQSTPRVKCP